MADAQHSTTASKFDRGTIMRAAHFTAKWHKSAPGCLQSYRELFARALRHEWQKARADRLRRESNLGLPLRSCLADRQPRQFTRASGQLAHAFAS